MQITLEELTPHLHFGIRTYSAEASELGLRPGEEWPRMITVPGIGNGHAFYPRREIRDRAGEFGGRVYRQLYGCLELTIFND